MQYELTEILDAGQWWDGTHTDRAKKPVLLEDPPDINTTALLFQRSLHVRQESMIVEDVGGKRALANVGTGFSVQITAQNVQDARLIYKTASKITQEYTPKTIGDITWVGVESSKLEEVGAFGIAGLSILTVSAEVSEAGVDL